jgi:F-type H+-transporting ATPase subunit b
MTKQNHNQIRAAIVAFAAVTATAAPAFAAGGDGFPWVHWGVSVLNFAIFLGIIIYFAGGKIQGFFKNRRDDLLADLNEAKKLRKQAQEKLDEYSRRLDALDEERDALLDDYRTQGEREKERLIADAKRQVEKMRSDAELVIQQEVRKAVASIEQQAVDLAVDMARKSLDEKLDPRTQNVLVDQYVDDLKSLEG